MSIKEVTSSPVLVNASSEPAFTRSQSKTFDVLESPKGNTTNCWQSFVNGLKKIWKAIINFICCRKNEIKEQTESKEAKTSLVQALQKFHNPKCSGIIHGVYMTTNETALEKTRKFFANAAQIKGCHIGCASWHNFDIIVARKSAYSLIFDFNPENKKFMDATIDILKNSPTREIFVEKMTCFLKKGSIHFCQKPQLDSVGEMQGELKREGSWLSREESYLCVRNLALNDRITVITETIRNTKTFEEIKSLLNESKVAVDTLYLSNICIFMRSAQEKEDFASSVQAILDPKTIVINCPAKTTPSFQGENIANPLEQHVCLGEALQKDKNQLFVAGF